MTEPVVGDEFQVYQISKLLLQEGELKSFLPEEEDALIKDDVTKKASSALTPPPEPIREISK